MTTRLISPLLLATVVVAGAPTPTPAQTPAPTAPATTTTPRPARADGPARPRPLPPRESLRAIRERGVLRACLAPTSPWAIPAVEGQSPTGFSVEIATQLAEDLGVELQLVPTSAPDLIASLFEGACDIVPGGLAATPDRALFLHFSTPIAEHDVEVVGPAGSAATLATLDAATVTVGVVEGSAEQRDARRALPRASLKTFESQSALGEALARKEVQAAVVAAPFSDIAAKESDGALAVLATPLARRRESLAVRRGDLEWLAYLNTWVQARVDEGWLATAHTRWFTSLDWLAPAAR